MLFVVDDPGSSELDFVSSELDFGSSELDIGSSELLMAVSEGARTGPANGPSGRAVHGWSETAIRRKNRR